MAAKEKQRLALVGGALCLVIAVGLLLVPTSTKGESCGSFLAPRNPTIRASESEYMFLERMGALNDEIEAAVDINKEVDSVEGAAVLEAAVRGVCEDTRQARVWPEAPLVALVAFAGLLYGLAPSLFERRRQSD
jgi:hypothetical protein